MEKTPKQLIDQYVDESYDKGTEEIVKKNLHLSMKLSGLLSMMDAYFTAYQQNKKEIIKISYNIVKDKREGEAYRKHINQKVKNQYNKLGNETAQFDKFVKKFSKEFNDIMGQTDLPDQLIDVFEKFWDRHVVSDEETVTIKNYKYD